MMIILHLDYSQSIKSSRGSQLNDIQYLACRKHMENDLPGSVCSKLRLRDMMLGRKATAALSWNYVVFILRKTFHRWTGFAITSTKQIIVICNAYLILTIYPLRTDDNYSSRPLQLKMNAYAKHQGLAVDGNRGTLFRA